MPKVAIFRLNESTDAASKITETDLSIGNIFFDDFVQYRNEAEENDKFEEQVNDLGKLLVKMGTSKHKAVEKNRWTETNESRYDLIKKAFSEDAISIRYLIHIKNISKPDVVKLICGMDLQNMKRLCHLFLSILSLPFDVFNACLERLSPSLTHSGFYYFLFNLCSSLKIDSGGSCILIDSKLVEGKSFRLYYNYWKCCTNNQEFFVHRAFGLINYAQSLLESGLSSKDVCSAIELTNDIHHASDKFTGSHMCHQALCVCKDHMWFEVSSVNSKRNACKKNENPTEIECPFDLRCLVHDPNFVPSIITKDSENQGDHTGLQNNETGENIRNELEQQKEHYESRINILESEKFELETKLEESEKIQKEQEAKINELTEKLSELMNQQPKRKIAKENNQMKP